MNYRHLIQQAVKNNIIDLEWGQLSWLVNSELMQEAQSTMGVVTIFPGKRNPYHLHPNCEEVLYVLSGTCDHKIGDENYLLQPGDVICIPKGVKHYAYCTSQEPLKAVISFSSPDRETIIIED
ncbi:cupin domain-containing protein [Pseudalkalibacillus sp. R45]|uniref:cupin domain-containing protein n=1 Tax=Pseudalkalibacillus sp. R45 TaxID=3457433 RepID=UPI003FCC3475